jgi:radical SAM superfamily enzyme YgiQ (UPF0313 family)
MARILLYHGILRMLSGISTNHRPRAGRARVLLTSVFGPFSVDDDFGSRAINPLELYHNQVTRAQGPFSLRMHHRSWGIMLIQHNLAAPSTLLDFPTRHRFLEELTSHSYDVVGISGIVVNVGKVREMCRLVRRHSPHSVIVVGGHVTSIPGVDRLVDADYIVRGEGIRWFREFLGEPTDTPVTHPAIPSSFGFRLMGLKAPRGGGDPAATIIPSVGCPMGCAFCTTSSFFGGKGRFVNFYETGKQLFDVMAGIERELGVRTFFMMDENFLLYRRRALELLGEMKRHRRSWALYVFSSANAIRKYEIRQLIELGVNWVWLGFESPRASYPKLNNADTLALTRELQTHGIHVQGSTIIGLDHHTPRTLGAEIEHAVSHDADCHQFMLYTPMPGTPLYDQMQADGRMLSSVAWADMHGQYKFNFRHDHIGHDESKEWLDWAFQRDFDVNGPSLFRIVRTMFAGWQRYGRDPDDRVRERYAADARKLRNGYGATLWAMERYLHESNPAVSARIGALRCRVEAELGGLSPVVDRIVGAALLWSARREATRHPSGRALEPRTFVERRNWRD